MQSTGLRLNSVKHCRLFRMSNHGIHRANIFLITHISYRTYAAFWEVFAISRTINRRPANTSSWTSVTLSSMVAVFIASKCSSSKTDVRPRCHSLNQCFLITIYIIELAFTAWFPSQNKKSNQRRYCSFFCVNSTNTLTSKRGQKKTAN